MTSVWSFQMLMGLERERLASTMTTGSLIAAVQYTISLMRINPWELVQVKLRAPAAADPVQTLMAECSDSTGTNSASSSPLLTNSDRRSTIWV